MRSSIWTASGCSIVALALGAWVLAEPPKQDMPPLPAGWTMEDVQAITEAGAVNKQHHFLAQSAGTWEGRCTSLMSPEGPEVHSTTTMNATLLMDGRFLQVTTEGEMPGMGLYKGMGVYGFDNVTRQFTSVWFDNMGTGLMNGIGELSDDWKTFTTHYTYNCPITRKPAKMREVETQTGPNTRRLEMYANDPKTGKEFKMMTIEFTKKS